jgi:hypothetical protein
MTTSAIRVHRPLERDPRNRRYAVDGGLGADLVETGVERLRGVEPADDDVLGEAREAGVAFGIDGL